jgi:hypothetical protein
VDVEPAAREHGVHDDDMSTQFDTTGEPSRPTIRT